MADQAATPSSSSSPPLSPRGSLSASVRSRWAHHGRKVSWARKSAGDGMTSSSVDADVGEGEGIASTASTNDPPITTTPPQQQPQLASQAQAQPPPGNPIEPHLRFITTSFAITSCAALILARIHWFLAALALATGCHILCKTLVSRGQDVAAEQQSLASQQIFAGKDHTETVEWLNVLLGSVWPLISADLFTPFVDLLEDAMQQLMPGIVHAVRVEDLDQGDVPLKIDSLKVLPNDENHFVAGPATDATESRIDDAEGKSSVDLGEHVNLEVTFSYRAITKGMSSTSSNVSRDEKTGHAHGTPRDSPAEAIHLLLYLAIGLQKIAAVEVPVWVEMVGIQGKMRLRLQLVPALPFVKHVGFTLLEQPKLEIKAKPLGRRMVIDAMNLPLLSSYVLRSVQKTVQPFVAPSSYTIDFAAILGAGDGPKNTYAVGIIAVAIHSAHDLPAADVNGLADPFVTLSFARSGKPLFRTRVLRRNKNPVWGGEVAYLLVGPDEVRDHDRLRFTVFDADRFSADDPLGKVDVPVDRLIKESLKRDTDLHSCAMMETRDAELQPMRRGGKVQGTLRYSIVFARLVQPEGCAGTMASPTRSQLMDDAARRAASGEYDREHAAVPADAPSLEPKQATTTAATAPEPTDLSHMRTPFDSFIHPLGLPLDDSILRARQERHDRVTKLTSLLSGEEAAVASPPAQRWPSGILAFHVHSIYGLEVTRTQRTLSKGGGGGGGGSGGGADDDEGGSASTLDSHSRLPSSYVQVLLNDEAVLVTRVKTLNPRPFINAGSERFVPDFSRARVDFVVRDRRQREGDPILGVVSLDVGETLANSARWSGWCTMEGGLGYGKVRVTLLWRSIHFCVPRPLRGWSVGTLCVAAIKAVVGTEAGFEGRDAHWVLDGRWGRATTDSMRAGEGEEGAVYEYDSPQLRLPMRSRYPSALTLTLRASTARLPGRHRRRVIACLPLDRTLVDGEQVTLRVGLYATSDHRAVEALARTASKRGAAHEHKHAHRHAALKDIVEAPLYVSDDDEREAAAGDETVLSASSDDGSEVEGEDPGPASTSHAASSSRMHRSPSSSSSSHRRAAHLTLVGHVDVTLRFTPGVSEAHASLLGGDHELRYAHEAWLCKRDASMRTTPPAPPQDEQGDDGAVPNDEDEELTTFLRSNMAASQHPTVRRQRPRSRSPSPTRSHHSSSHRSSSSPPPPGLATRIAQRHRNEAGLAQLKPYRTLRWLKQNVDDGVGNLRRRGLMAGMEKREERVAKMEREGVSGF